MAGLAIIVLSVVIAIFGYLMVPDGSTNANQQIVELKLRKPGFKIQLLKVRINQPVEKSTLLERLWHGYERKYNLIPILGFSFQNEYLLYEHYTGNPEKGIQKSISLADISYALAAGEPVLSEDKFLIFKSTDGTNHRESIAALQKQVETDFIGEKRFLLGTDGIGRDYWSRLILGTRVSISVGLMAVLISLLIGILMGSMAGYFRGKVDDIIMYIINVFWSIPTLLLALSLSLVLSQGLWQVFVAIGLTMWIELARIVRGQIMVVREMEYVEAAKSLGFGHIRIIFRHILPNIIGPVIVVLASNFAAAILLEAGLSFLGLGVERPMPSWGMMLSDNRTYLVAGLPHLAIIPGIAISILVLSFFLLGNGLRDAFDVKTKV